jgi:hypothetical protein
MRFTDRLSKRALVTIAAFAAALIAEFLILEGTLGVSLPSDRYSARSTVKITDRGLERNFAILNQRFSVVDLIPLKGRPGETLVLRETFFRNYEPDLEGHGGHGVVTVEAMVDGHVRWGFQEAGDRGDPYDLVYRVTKLGCCDAPPTSTYFSLLDGRKLRADEHELSNKELEDLELSVTK